MIFFAFLSNLMDLLFVAGVVALGVKLVSKKKKISQKEVYKHMHNNIKKEFDHISKYIKLFKEVNKKESVSSDPTER